MKKIKIRFAKPHEKYRHYTFLRGYQSPESVKALYKKLRREYMTYYINNHTLPMQVNGVDIDVMEYSKNIPNDADKILSNIIKPQVEFLEETWKIICR